MALKLASRFKLWQQEVKETLPSDKQKRQVDLGCEPLAGPTRFPHSYPNHDRWSHTAKNAKLCEMP